MKTEIIIDNECIDLIDHSLSGLEVSLEQFFKEWEASKSRNDALSIKYRSLQESHEILQSELTDQQETIQQQQEEINNLSELVKGLQSQRNDFLQETKQDMQARTELLNAKYQVSYTPLPYALSHPLTISLLPFLLFLLSFW